MFHIIGAMAEFERELIRERVKAGIENARRKGKRLGRKPIPPVEMARVIETYEPDPTASIRQLASKAKLKFVSTALIIRDYKAGLMDHDGFRYTTPLVTISKTPTKIGYAQGENKGVRQAV